MAFGVWQRGLSMADLTSGLVASGISACSQQGDALLTQISHNFTSGLTVILGANGAGKTSLMRALAGELPVTGKVTLDGVELTQLRKNNQLSQRLAFLPQHSQLQFPLLVHEVIELGLYNRVISSQQRLLLLQKTAQLFGLEKLWSKEFTLLSGGEQSRVHLARVYIQLMPNPEGAAPNSTLQYLLLDEPVAALDIPHQHQVMRLLTGAYKKTIAVIAVLHDINLALRYATHVMLIKESQLIAAGPIGTTLTESLLQETYDTNIRLVQIPGTNYLSAVFN